MAYLYIFARSSSSLDHQAQFHKLRAHNLADMDADLHTDAGVPVHDVTRFFHGDGPAQQVEAGAKIGGNALPRVHGMMTSHAFFVLNQE